MPEDKRLRLEASWAHPFQQRILPLIDEEAFRDAFSDETGRPNKSIRLLTGLHLLKEWNDLTDAQVLEQFEFNLQWHYALGVEPGQAHVCQKTLHNYRVLLISNERARQAFESLTRGLVELDDLDVGRQRLDSTHVISNIAVLTRLGLFTETMTKFLRELRREALDKLAQLDGGYAERYLDREGYFADATKEQARRRLPLVAVDVYRLVQAFAQDEAVSQWESYRLLERLFEEQCEVVEGTEEGATPIKLVDEPATQGEVEVQPKGDEPELAPEADGGAPTSAESDSESSESGPVGGDAGAQEAASRLAGAEETGGETEATVDDPGEVSEADAAADRDEPAAAPEAATGAAGPAGTGAAQSREEPEERTLPVKPRDAKTISSSSLQSPHDPDATYGRKGKGYEVQVAETCAEDNPYQVITGISVNGAHESDQHAVVPMVEQLEASQLKPDELLADTGYGSGQNIIECAKRSVDLQAPVQDPDAPERQDPWVDPVEPVEASPPRSLEAVAEEGSPPSEPVGASLGLESFAFNETFGEVLLCPAGHEPSEQRLDEAGRMLWVQFSDKDCASCPLAASCPTRAKESGDRTLRFLNAKAATAHRQAEQQGREFKERYKMRSGVESANAEAKGRHGAGNFRVRGQPRLTVAMLLKTMALNAKRAVQYRLAKLRKALEVEPEAVAVGS
jgi:hypothetical protein